MPWLRGLKALLKRTTRIGRRRPDVADSTLAVYQSLLQARLDDLFKIVPATKAGQKLLRVTTRFRQNLLSSSPIAPSRQPITAPNKRYGPTSSSVRSPIASDPNGAQTLYANVRSVIEPARRRGILILRAIKLTLQGTPLPTAA